MFGVNWNDPQTLWLNLTNLALGVMALVCVGAVAYNIATELLARRRRFAAMDHEVNAMLASDSHALNTPELGWTMADGGEPVPPQVFRRKPGKSGKPSR
jgi:hypothetical protein